MQFKKFAFFLISIIFIFSGCDSKNDESSSSKNEIENRKETNFILKTQNQTILTLSKENELFKFKELQNKIVLVNFFATWCPPCKAEIPHLIDLKNKYMDKFETVAINMGNKDGSIPNIESFIEEYKINYPVITNEKNKKIAELFGGVKAIPTMFMLDTNGKIIQKYVGIVPQEMIETDIKRILGK